MANHANTIPLDRKAIMTRAWELMRTKYRLGSPFTFKEIGRGCFAWCLKEAWREVKAAACIAALSVADRTAKIARLTADLEAADYLPGHMSVSRRKDSIRAELVRLAA